MSETELSRFIEFLGAKGLIISDALVAEFKATPEPKTKATPEPKTKATPEPKPIPKKGCRYIFKRGPRKGEKCGKTKNEYCSLHKPKPVEGSDSEDEKGLCKEYVEGWKCLKEVVKGEDRCGEHFPGEIVPETVMEGGFCNVCKCRKYPDCEAYGEACEECIDGASGSHKWM